MQAVAVIEWLHQSRLAAEGPTAVLCPAGVVNHWEQEFRRFAPGLRIALYSGNPTQRAQLCSRWNLPVPRHLLGGVTNAESDSSSSFSAPGSSSSSSESGSEDDVVHSDDADTDNDDSEVVAGAGGGDGRIRRKAFSTNPFAQDEVPQQTIQTVLAEPPASLPASPKFDCDAVIMSYDLARRDSAAFQQVAWSLLVVDEAHRLKSMTGRLFQVVAHEWRPRPALLLTGTPLQNRLDELYALLHLSDPKVFANDEDSARVFSRQFEYPTEDHRWQSLVYPFLLRRTSSVVGSSVDGDGGSTAAVMERLPPLTEVVVATPLSPLQREWYRGVLRGRVGDLSHGDRVGLQNIVMQLRKVCNHPYLFDGAEPEPFAEGDHLAWNSGKLAALHQLLPQLRRDGHRVLLFSYSTRMLDILQDYVNWQGWPHERLDGSLRGEDRWAAIRRFHACAPNESTIYEEGTEPEAERPFCFLVSTLAGGLGLTLTAADTVILYDSGWNPQWDRQAIKRAHRVRRNPCNIPPRYGTARHDSEIGQRKPVHVIRLVSRGTLEEVVLDRALRKLSLSDAVLGKVEHSYTRGASEQISSLSGSQLLSLVRHGLYGIEQQEKDSHDAALERDVASRERLTLSRDTRQAILARGDEESEDSIVCDNTGAFRVVRVGRAAATSQGLSLKNQNAGGEESAARDDVYEWEGRTYTPCRDDNGEDVLDPTSADAKALAALMEEGETEQRRGRRGTPSTEATSPRRVRSTATSEQQPRHWSKWQRWEAQGYKSHVLPRPSERIGADKVPASSDRRHSSVDVVSFLQPGRLHFTVGDVAFPHHVASPSHPCRAHPLWGKGPVRLLLHAVDGSGRWATGGVFSALDRRSRNVRSAYEAAGAKGDLRRGDLLVVPLPPVEQDLSTAESEEPSTSSYRVAPFRGLMTMDDGPPREGPGHHTPSPSDFVVLLVCLHRPGVRAGVGASRQRPQRGKPPMLDKAALDVCLGELVKLVQAPCEDVWHLDGWPWSPGALRTWQERQARREEKCESTAEAETTAILPTPTLHAPRLGAGLRDASFYSVERYLRKHLLPARLPTWIYYHPPARSRGSAGSEPAAKRRRRMRDGSSGTAPWQPWAVTAESEGLLEHIVDLHGSLRFIWDQGVHELATAAEAMEEERAKRMDNEDASDAGDVRVLSFFLRVVQSRLEELRFE